MDTEKFDGVERRPLKPEEIEGNRAAMEEYLEAAAQYRKEQEAR